MDTFWKDVELYTKRKRTPNEYGSEHAVDGRSNQLVPEQVLPVPTPNNFTLSDESVKLCVGNPYIVNENGGLPNHPRLSSLFRPVVVPENLRVSGLIKFDLRFRDSKDLLAPYRRNNTKRGITKVGELLHLPRNFGQNFDLGETDMRSLKFYLTAFCAGRTLLENSNVWLKGIPAIAEKSACVRHALLSLSASYILDYHRTELFKWRANSHHKYAVMLLGAELNKSTNYNIGSEEPLLMAIALLNQQDGINWETREENKHCPKWYRGAKAVKMLLEKSDPGRRYQNPTNVQSTSNRYYMGQHLMKSLILSDTVAPLEDEADEQAFKWLLEGNERDVRRINGLAGCCAKILHIFSQITRWCKQMQDNPDSPVVAAAGKVLLENLTNFQQWSDLGEPFATPEDLFDACESDLDDQGNVQTSALSVALNGEAHVQSAQIYLFCRLFRRPRHHPEVQNRLKNLIKCTDWLPLEGPLYTSQDSLYGFVMACLVAISEEDRDRLQRQFKPLQNGIRSNDVLICGILERLWVWLDEHVTNDDSEEKPLKDRAAWWEAMAKHIFETEGRLNLL